MSPALNLVAGKSTRDHVKQLQGLNGFYSFLVAFGQIIRIPRSLLRAVIFTASAIAELHF